MIGGRPYASSGNLVNASGRESPHPSSIGQKPSTPGARLDKRSGPGYRFRVALRTAVILVSGRTAVAKVGVVPSVVRHVEAARSLGLRPMVVYPPKMRVLGAEIEGLLDERVDSVAADRLPFQDPTEAVLVLAADWYISLRAMAAFAATEETPALARVAERGMVSFPMAKVTVSALETALKRLGSVAPGPLLSRMAGTNRHIMSLEARYQHRLSDDRSIGHAEDKALGRIVGPRFGLDPARLKRLVATPLIRMVASRRALWWPLLAMKPLVGLAAAWVLAEPSYGAGLAGALLLWGCRILDAAASGVARLTVRDNVRREQLSIITDVGILVVIILALLVRYAGDGPVFVYGTTAALGIVIGAAVLYRLVLRNAWIARARGNYSSLAVGGLAPRFAHGDGATYGVILAALMGRLDLFLAAAALASHLFYIFWLVSVRGATDGSGAGGTKGGQPPTDPRSASTQGATA